MDTTNISIMPEFDPRYPLCYSLIAVHLGITEYREDNAEENKRRAKRLLEVYSGENAILRFNDGQALEPHHVTDEFMAQHLGQRVNLGFHTPESFDDHMLDVIAGQTGKPRVSYVHIRIHHRWPDAPCDVYQEIGDKEGEERRRVEVYLDGRHLWVEDNYEGTGETDKEDTHFPGLAILNARHGQTAAMIEESHFEELWERAVKDTCDWPGTGEETTETCQNERTPGSPFCTGHQEMARMLFPRLFATA